MSTVYTKTRSPAEMALRLFIAKFQYRFGKSVLHIYEATKFQEECWLKGQAIRLQCKVCVETIELLKDRPEAKVVREWKK